MNITNHLKNDAAPTSSASLKAGFSWTSASGQNIASSTTCFSTNSRSQLVTIFIGIVSIFVMFVAPKFEQIFKDFGIPLPWVTRLMRTCSGRTWGVGVAVGATGAVAFNAAYYHRSAVFAPCFTGITARRLCPACR